MHATGGGKNRGTAGREGQSNQIVSRNRERRLMPGSDSHDPATAIERCSDIQVAIDIDCQSLRAAESAVKDADLAVGVDLIDGIEAGGGGSGDVKIVRQSPKAR